MEKKKILILTAPFGSGHLQVSQALVREFSLHKDVEVEEYDLFSEEFPIIAKTLQRAYLQTYKPIGKDIYRMLYYTSNQAIHDSLRAKLLKPYLEFGIRSLRHKLETFDPDAIISVFPVTSLYQLQKKKFKVPIYTVITDYYANGLWLYKGARRHYIATHRIAAWGVANGLTQRQFKLTGIPVHHKFDLPLSRMRLLKKYDLNQDKQTVLIVAGTHGVLPNVFEITQVLVEQEQVQIVVVCGRNESLYEELSVLSETYSNLRVIGYSKEMHELLEVADVMITKPGGISVTEAAIKGVPVLFYNPVYGQELENAKFFSEKKAGLIVSNKTELIYQLVVLLNEDNVLQEMKENIKSLGYSCSAAEIVRDVLQDSEAYYEEQEAGVNSC